MTATLLVSLLPRGMPYGSSALAALDVETLSLCAYREIPSTDYIQFPDNDNNPTTAPVEHCRGLARFGGRLLVALFNSVREYEVERVDALRLRPSRVFTHHVAVDIHGIDADDKKLAATSTGADAIISWNLFDYSSSVLEFGSPNRCADLRFPAQRAMDSGSADWRNCLPGRLHLNDVSLSDRGMLVCSLSRVFAQDGPGWRTLLVGAGSAFHDGRYADDGTVLVTDASCGVLTVLDPFSAKRFSVSIAPSDQWFVRGLEITSNYVYVLRSEVASSQQRNVRHPGFVSRYRGGKFGISVIDRSTWSIVADKVVALPEAAPGTVAYKVLLWA